MDAVDVEKRFEKTLPLLARQIEGLRLLRHAKRGGNNRRPNGGDKVRLPPAFKDKNSVVIVKSDQGRPRFINQKDREDEESEGDEITELEKKIK